MTYVGMKEIASCIATEENIEIMINSELGIAKSKKLEQKIWNCIQNKDVCFGTITIDGNSSLISENDYKRVMQLLNSISCTIKFVSSIYEYSCNSLWGQAVN